ncbi:MAG: serpin family protein [Anaerolineae bacterium]|nr:serpin family protein [Anaerolineae bacterium]MDW8172940.1 serpin family protein [Anaerolineae bacterium]
MMKTLRYFLSLALLGGILGAVSAQDDRVAALVQANNIFAGQMFQRLRQADEQGNLFFSPYSIYQALALTYQGAHGTTAQEMAQALGWQDMSLDGLAQDFATLNSDLLARANRAEGVGELRIANSLWGEQSYAFAEGFLRVLDESFGAPMRLVDFLRASEAARQAINAWVAEQTANKIQDLVPQGAVDETTRLVLANAIYFKDAWFKPFIEGATSDADFFLLGGGSVRVPMMRLSDRLGYFADEGVQAVELAYSNANFTMLLVVPALESYASWEADFSADDVDAILNAMRVRQVNLGLPRFRVEGEFSLRDALQALGIVSAFDPEQADFSGMRADAARDLFISAALHKSYIDVNEEGTEAAAATGIIMGVTSAMPDQPIDLTIDRPFVFLIRDRQSGAVLFMGRVLNPAS